MDLMPQTTGGLLRWTMLRATAAATDFPHLYTFAALTTPVVNSHQSVNIKPPEIQSVENRATLAGVEVVVSAQQADDGSYGTDLTFDECLWVVAVAPGGMADISGVTPGLRLIGFQRRKLGETTTLSALKAAVLSEPFPHYLTFADVDPAAGEAAVTAYADLVAAEKNRKDEILAALELLTSDDAEPLPDRELAAMCGISKTASNETAELTAGWMYTRMASKKVRMLSF